MRVHSEVSSNITISATLDSSSDYFIDDLPIFEGYQFYDHALDVLKPSHHNQGYEIQVFQESNKRYSLDDGLMIWSPSEIGLYSLDLALMDGQEGLGSLRYSVNIQETPILGFNSFTENIFLNEEGDFVFFKLQLPLVYDGDYLEFKMGGHP